MKPPFYYADYSLCKDSLTAGFTSQRFERIPWPLVSSHRGLKGFPDRCYQVIEVWECIIVTEGGNHEDNTCLIMYNRCYPSNIIISFVLIHRSSGTIRESLWSSWDHQGSSSLIKGSSGASGIIRCDRWFIIGLSEIFMNHHGIIVDHQGSSWIVVFFYNLL